MHYRAALSLAATLAILTPQAVAAADGYPSRPVRFVVAFPPGGGTDIIARSIAQKLAERIAQPVVVDNRPGAGGNIGTDIVAKSAPDGYTLLMGSAGPLAINASLFAKMPFDPIKDLAPVTLAASTPNVLVVHPSLRAATVKELIALAKARPGEINFASSGTERPRTWRGSCSTRWRESGWFTCRTRVRHRRLPTCSAARCSSCFRPCRPRSRT